MTLSIASTAGMARSAGAFRTPRFRRLLIVSSRLPCIVRLDGGSVRLAPSRDGLITGLRCVHESSTGAWIGWSGLAEAPGPIQYEIDARLADAGTLRVPLGNGEAAAFYGRIANRVLWGLLHEVKSDLLADPADWATYRTVNARFADVVLRELRAGDRVWIHDYHLMLLPRLLRQSRPDVQVGFFLHTPFPNAEALASLPEAAVLIDGVLGADVIGFHTRAYVEHFASAVRSILGRRVELVSGTGTVDDWGRPVCLHANPMSVDVAAVSARADDPWVAPRVAALRAAGCPLLVAVDRVDPTKGIPQRLEAFGRLLALRADLRGRARLLQVAMPWRAEGPAYRALLRQIETMVGDLNARFGTPTWTPVEYVYGSVDAAELAALYRAADVMLVTPLRDGMSFVAKEFVASRADQDGVLVLSEHEGAAAELTAALLVDPRDIDGVARACATALDMSPAERRVRMRRLRARVRAHDVRRWADVCLHELDAAVRMSRHTES